MKISQVQMSPNEAERILTASQAERQRPLNPARVRNLAGAITSGQWRVTHQGIAFSESGSLIDGQHRLAAIALAGQTVPILVTEGLPDDAFDAIDTGRTRTPATALTIAGYSNTNVLASAARYYLTYQAIAGDIRLPSGELRASFTTHDLLTLLDTATGAAILGALTPAQRMAASLGRPGITTWLATALAVLDDVGPDVQLRSQFVEAVENGTMLDARSPILYLRRWLTSENGYAGLARASRGYIGIALVVKAWNAWLNSEEWTAANVRFKPGTDPFPVPMAHAPIPDYEDA
jgi:hypothetical protein